MPDVSPWGLKREIVIDLTRHAGSPKLWFFAAIPTDRPRRCKIDPQARSFLTNRTSRGTYSDARALRASGIAGCSIPPVARRRNIRQHRTVCSQSRSSRSKIARRVGSARPRTARSGTPCTNSHNSPVMTDLGKSVAPLRQSVRAVAARRAIPQEIAMGTINQANSML